MGGVALWVMAGMDLLALALGRGPATGIAGLWFMGEAQHSISLSLAVPASEEGS